MVDVIRGGDPELEARAAGHSWDDIDGFVQDRTQAALNAGYTQDDVDQYLGRGDPTEFDIRSQGAWTGHFAENPDQKEHLTADEPRLISLPSLRSSYATAMQLGEVKGPQDFADRSAVSMVDAADLPPEAKDKALRNASQTAIQVAQGLPPERDFTDAALSLAPEGETQQAQSIKDGLIQHWADTGEHPVAAASRGFVPPVKDDTSFEPMTDIFGVGVAAGQVSQQDMEMYKAFGHGFIRGVLPGFVASPAGAGGAAAGAVVGGPVGAVLGALVVGGGAFLLADELQTKVLEQTPTVAKLFAQDPEQRKKDWDEHPLALTAGNLLSGAIPSPLDFLSPAFKSAGKYLAQTSDAVLRDTAGTARWGQDLSDYELAVLRKTLSPKAAAVEAVENEIRLRGDKYNPEPQVNVFDPATSTETKVPISEALRPVEPAPIISGKPTETEPNPEPTIDPTASPAAKIERIVQLEMERLGSGPMPHLENGRFFQGLLEKSDVSDAATKELAEGYDHASSMAAMFRDEFGVKFEEPEAAAGGSGNEPPKPPVEEPIPEMPYPFANTRLGRIIGKNSAEDIIRQGLGYANQGIRAAAKRSQGFYRFFTSDMVKEFKAAEGEAKMDTMIGHFVDAVDTGSWRADKDSPLSAIASVYRDTEDFVHKQIIQDSLDLAEKYNMQVEDTGIHLAYLRDYLIHAFKNGDEAFNAFMSGKLGSKMSFMARSGSLPTMGDAIRAGLEPRFDNPADMLMYSITSKFRYAARVKMMLRAKNEGWIYWATRGKETPGDLPLKGAGTRVIGGGVEQNLYGRPGFVPIWNNTFATDGIFSATAAGRKIYDLLLGTKNVITSIKMALPMYHAFTTGVQTVAGGFGHAMQEFGGGEIGRGLLDTAMSATILPKMAQLFIKGRAGTLAHAAMANDGVIDHLVDTNFRFGSRNELYKIGKVENLFETLGRKENAKAYNPASWAWGELGHALKGDIFSNWFKTGGPVRTSARILNTVTAPLFDYAIPYIKLGSAMERVQTYIRQHPNADPDVLKKFVRQVSDNMDDRFGEYNMENVYWNPTVKNISNASLLSTGWTYGTIHHVAASFGWRLGRGAEWNPVALQNNIGLFITLAGLSSLYEYAHTGRVTADPRKLIGMFPAGGTSWLHTPSYGMLPGEQKEFYDWAGIVTKSWSTYENDGLIAGFLDTFKHTGEYAEGKLAPDLQLLGSIITGNDNFGRPIRSLPGGWPRYMEQEIMPIFLNQLDQHRPESGLSRTEEFTGVREPAEWAEAHAAWAAREAARDAKDRKAALWRQRYFHPPSRVAAPTSGGYRTGF